jgi:hypothetical protein
MNGTTDEHGRAVRSRPLPVVNLTLGDAEFGPGRRGAIGNWVPGDSDFGSPCLRLLHPLAELPGFALGPQSDLAGTALGSTIMVPSVL